MGEAGTRYFSFAFVVQVVKLTLVAAVAMVGTILLALSKEAFFGYSFMLIAISLSFGNIPDIVQGCLNFVFLGLGALVLKQSVVGFVGSITPSSPPAWIAQSAFIAISGLAAVILVLCAVSYCPPLRGSWSLPDTIVFAKSVRTTRSPTRSPTHSVTSESMVVPARDAATPRTSSGSRVQFANEGA